MLNQILQTLGHTPTKTTPTRTTYRSPWNIEEKTPSFFVFKNQQWNGQDPLREFNYKDNSSGKGGNIFHFVMSYFNISFRDAERKINELLGVDYQEHSVLGKNNHASALDETSKHLTPFSLNQQKEAYKITKVQTLQNKALLGYLSERKISKKFSEKYLGEIYYQIDNKKYFALSFLNNAGGREVRNKYFKGSFGKKDISLITPNPKDRRVKIFEGFMDFLSYLTINKNAPLSNYLILNSASMQEKGLKAVQGKFEAFELYLDNDNRGDEATLFFMQNLNNATDKRVHYKNYKDLNDFLMKREI